MEQIRVRNERETTRKHQAEKQSSWNGSALKVAKINNRKKKAVNVVKNAVKISLRIECWMVMVVVIVHAHITADTHTTANRVNMPVDRVTR